MTSNLDASLCTSVGVLSQLLVEGHISQNEFEERKSQLFDPSPVSRPTGIHFSKRSDVYSPYDLFDDSGAKPPSFQYSVYSSTVDNIIPDVEIVTSNDFSYSSSSSSDSNTWNNNFISDDSALISTSKHSFIPSFEQKELFKSQEPFHLNISDVDGFLSKVFCKPNDTIENILHKLGYAVENYCIRFNGKRLSNDSTIHSEDISNGDTVYLQFNPQTSFQQERIQYTLPDTSNEENTDINTKFSSVSPKFSFGSSSNFGTKSPLPVSFSNLTDSNPFGSSFSNTFGNTSSFGSSSFTSNASPSLSFGNLTLNDSISSNAAFSFQEASPPKKQSKTKKKFSSKKPSPIKPTSTTFTFSNTGNTNFTSSSDNLDLSSILEPFWYAKLSNLLINVSTDFFKLLHFI